LYSDNANIEVVNQTNLDNQKKMQDLENSLLALSQQNQQLQQNVLSKQDSSNQQDVILNQQKMQQL